MKQAPSSSSAAWLVIIVTILLSCLFSQKLEVLFSAEQYGCEGEVVQDGNLHQQACINQVLGSALGPNDTIYFIDTVSRAVGTFDSYHLRRYDPKTDNISTMRLRVQGGTGKSFNAIHTGLNGCLSPYCSTKYNGCFFACNGNNAIVFLNYDGVVEVFAGTVGKISPVLDGTVEDATFKQPGGLWMDSINEVMYVGSPSSSFTSIREINMKTKIVSSPNSLLTGVKTFTLCPGTDIAYAYIGTTLSVYDRKTRTFTLSATFSAITQMFCYNSVLYLLDGGILKKIASPTALTATAITGLTTETDGIGTAAGIKSFRYPIYESGAIYFQDTSYAIRKLDIATNQVSTVYPIATSGYIGDTNAFDNKFLSSTDIYLVNSTYMVAVYSNQLFVVDTTKHTVRSICNLLVSTHPYEKTAFHLGINEKMIRMVSDSHGNLYIPAYGNSVFSKIYKLTASGDSELLVSTLAGDTAESMKEGLWPNSFKMSYPVFYLLQDRYLYMYDSDINIGWYALDIVTGKLELVIPNKNFMLVDGHVSVASVYNAQAYGQMDNDRLIWIEVTSTNIQYRVFDNKTMEVTSYPTLSLTESIAKLNPLLLYWNNTVFGLQKSFFMNFDYKTDKHVYARCMSAKCVADTSTTTTTVGTMNFISTTEHGLFLFEGAALKRMLFGRPSPPSVVLLSNSNSNITLKISLPVSEWGGYQLTNFKVSYEKGEGITMASTIEVPLSDAISGTVTIQQLAPTTAYAIKVIAVTTAYESYSKYLLLSTTA